MRLPLAIALLATVPALAAAQDAKPRRMLSDACRTEIVNLCPKGGERGARRQCMMANRDKLSEGCKGELRTAMQARRDKTGSGTGDMAAPGAMTTEPQPK